MGLAQPKKTVHPPPEYYALEEAAEYESDYYKGEIFAMWGGTGRQSLISGNITRHVGNRLKKSPCVVYESNLRMKKIPCAHNDADPGYCTMDRRLSIVRRNYRAADRRACTPFFLRCRSLGFS
jgi:hypothetical protein